MATEILDMWEKALPFLKEESSDISYKTWIEPLRPSSLADSVFFLEAPSDLHKSTIESRFKDLIKNSINYANNTEVDIDILTASSHASPEPSVQPKKPDTQTDPGAVSVFKKELTFDSFIVGSNNFFAHAAAVAVAEAPAQSHNPLFIYGGSGLGKTHLLQAIGQYVMQHHKDKKVLYVSSEKYTNDLINSIKNSRRDVNLNEQFRSLYRNVDVLIIDDIQFICGKNSVQEELFHTFDALYQDNKQIVISSDQPPKDLEKLNERLRTRFGWGLTADIQKPDLETRVAILKRNIEKNGISIPNDVVLYIANNVKTSVRDLTGAFNRVVSFSSLTNKDLTVEIAQDALKDIISTYQPIINCDTIISIVARYFDIRIDEIKSTKKSSRISYPRQIAMYLCRHYTETTLVEIGHAFGRDYSTVIHGVDKIENDLSKKQQTINDIEELKKTIFYG